MSATAEQVAEVRGAEQYRISGSRGSGGLCPPEAVNNLGLMVPQTPPNWSISTIIQKLSTICM